jgi:hypothetical protein
MTRARETAADQARLATAPATEPDRRPADSTT